MAAIGTADLVAGFGLAGAQVHEADDPATVRAAWEALPAGVAVVVLTGAAADALGPERTAPGAPLTVVLPR
ncbi:V-type ATP synthase subunit F [Nocardioides sp. MAHUQ-72]|uniref:V-type ATP synthase subunit F n=1 Tax=unclassified Nocardioides TaxID=2615069 RepID=UPI003605EAE6